VKNVAGVFDDLGFTQSNHRDSAAHGCVEVCDRLDVLWRLASNHDDDGSMKSLTEEPSRRNSGLDASPSPEERSMGRMS